MEAPEQTRQKAILFSLSLLSLLYNIQPRRREGGEGEANEVFHSVLSNILVVCFI